MITRGTTDAYVPLPPAPAVVTTVPDPTVRYRLRGLGLPAVPGQQEYVDRVLDHHLSASVFGDLRVAARHFGVTADFRELIDQLGTAPGHTPPGFRLELELDADGTLLADLIRDISYDADGALRPTSVLYSADTANPYEIAPIAPLIANLTCNPGIIYDLFLNNPKANVGNRFKDRDEVMTEIGRVLGPAADISVELNNPFEKDLGKILEEAEHFREMLSRWRVVIKVPHTGPVNAENVGQLLTGSKRLDRRWSEPATEDAFRGHNLALMLHEHGFRVNYTLMFDPHQTQLAL
ncbi:MAG TPA: transaldolase family protein, partial [Coriobacteriia bacterium]|nr:transaldolase family protein [Coriobacteriia bacterium]